MAKNHNHHSDYEFADEVRVGICEQYGLDTAFAKRLPTPEMIIAAVEYHTINEIDSIQFLFKAAMQNVTNLDNFEAEQKKFLERANEILTESFEIGNHPKMFELSSEEEKRELYHNMLDDIMGTIFGKRAGSEEDRDRAHKDAMNGFQAPLIRDVETALVNFRREQMQANLITMHGKRNGNGNGNGHKPEPK